MNPSRRTATRRIASFVAAAMALTAASFVAGSPAEAKRTHKPVSCKISTLDSATAKHTATFSDGGVTAEDDWDAVQSLCNNENVTGPLTAKSTLTVRRTNQRSKTAPSKGVISGPIVLGYSFGATQTGSWQLRGSAPYTCTADGACTFSGKVTKNGKTAGKWSGSFVRPTATVEGYFKVTFEDIIVSS